MRKFWAMLFAVLLIMSLVGCGGTPKEMEAPKGVTPNNGQSGNGQATNNPSKPVKATIEETVLLDESGVKITAKSLDLDSSWAGPELKLVIENNSGQDLTVQARNTSVNGYMVETIMSVDVVNGKKANDSLTFMESSLEMCNIKTIADIEFSFYIFDSESWDEYLESDPIVVKTSAADTYEYAYDDSGELAYEADGVKIVVKGLVEDANYLGTDLVVYIENNTDRFITVQTNDVSVNGFMLDPIFSCDVAPGKHAIDGMTFMSTELEENEITDIASVELSFHIFDLEDWMNSTDTESITITF